MRGQYPDKSGFGESQVVKTSNRIDKLEEESRRMTSALATLNDILLTEGKILDILVNTLADMEEKGGKNGNV